MVKGIESSWLAPVHWPPRSHTSPWGPSKPSTYVLKLGPSDPLVRTPELPPLCPAIALTPSPVPHLPTCNMKGQPLHVTPTHCSSPYHSPSLSFIPVGQENTPFYK